MTDTTQPEALQLAQFFESMTGSSHRWHDGVPVHEKAAAELRRLHALTTELQTEIARRDEQEAAIGAGGVEPLRKREQDAARAQPAGMEPAAWLATYQDRGGNEANYTTTHHALAVENDANGAPQALYTAAQVLAMGRVPPTHAEIEQMAVKHEAFGFGQVDYKGLTTHGFDPEGLLAFVNELLSAAPRPPAAQEAKTVACACGDEFPIESYGAGFLDAKGKCFGCDAGAEAAQERKPLDPVAAIKLGMAADDATRKHCRGTTNWACAITRFYETAHGIINTAP